jgi:hypothetical protein
LEAWRAAASADPEQWREAPFVSQSMGWLTADELAQVNEEMTQILVRHIDSINDPASRPAGARPIRFVRGGFRLWPRRYRQPPTQGRPDRQKETPHVRCAPP